MKGMQRNATTTATKFKEIKEMQRNAETYNEMSRNNRNLKKSINEKKSKKCK